LSEDFWRAKFFRLKVEYIFQLFFCSFFAAQNAVVSTARKFRPLKIVREWKTGFTLYASTMTTAIT